MDLRHTLFSPSRSRISRQQQPCGPLDASQITVHDAPESTWDMDGLIKDMKAAADRPSGHIFQKDAMDVNIATWKDGIFATTQVYEVSAGPLCHGLKSSTFIGDESLSFFEMPKGSLDSPKMVYPRTPVWLGVPDGLYMTSSHSFFEGGCAGIFTMSWFKYEVTKRNTKPVGKYVFKPGYALKPVERTSLICTTDFRVGKFQVTTDSAGKVDSSSLIEDLSDSLDKYVSVQKSRVLVGSYSEPYNLLSIPGNNATLAGKTNLIIAGNTMRARQQYNYSNSADKHVVNPP